MSTSARLLVLAASAAAAVVLFLVFRNDDDNGMQAQTTTTRTTTGTTTTVQAPRPTIFRINTRTAGIKRISVEQGDRVVIIVSADRSEEIHLHGYDLKAEATTARPGRIAFRADEPGRFEIEFEDSGEQIAELTVNP